MSSFTMCVDAKYGNSQRNNTFKECNPITKMDDHNKLPELDNDERNIFLHADGVIKDYQATHKEKVPKCIKMNTDNAELLKNTLRKITRVPATAEITQMRGSQIIIDDQLDLNGIVADDE